MTRQLKGIGGAALSTEKRQARTFWTTVAPQGRPSLGEGVAKLWLDGRVKASLKESVPLIGAPEAWAAGYDGKGVKVVVLDTGIDVNHPDFAGLIDGTASFVPGEAVTDVNGHGTHVAGTIVGSGAASGGANKGVAPAPTCSSARSSVVRRAPARTPGSWPACSGPRSPVRTSST